MYQLLRLLVYKKLSFCFILYSEYKTLYKTKHLQSDLFKKNISEATFFFLFCKSLYPLTIKKVVDDSLNCIHFFSRQIRAVDYQ